MESVILGGGLLYLLLFCVFALAFCIMWVVLLVRAAISNRWTTPLKIFWIVGILVFPPLALVYAFVERSVWWKSYAALNLVLATPLVLFAVFGDHEKTKAVTETAVVAAEAMAGVQQRAAPARGSRAAPAGDALAGRMKTLGDRLDALAQLHKDNMDGLSYMGASMQLMAWDLGLRAGTVTAEQITPHVASLENLLSDDVLTDEEITAWMNELKAAGLVKSKN